MDREDIDEMYGEGERVLDRQPDRPAGPARPVRPLVRGPEGLMRVRSARQILAAAARLPRLSDPDEAA